MVDSLAVWLAVAAALATALAGLLASQGLLSLWSSRSPLSFKKSASSAEAGGPLARLGRLVEKVHQTLSWGDNKSSGAAMEVALMALSSSLKAGRSLPQALEHAAIHAGGPLGEELAAVALQARGGDWLGAFDAWVERRPTNEVKALRSAIYIHGITGGGLSPLLGRLANTVRARLLYEGEVRSRTVEARGSAYILAVAPLILLVYMAFMQRENLIYLVIEPFGLAALIYGIASWLTGIVVISRLLKSTEAKF